MLRMQGVSFLDGLKNYFDVAGQGHLKLSFRNGFVRIEEKLLTINAIVHHHFLGTARCATAIVPFYTPN
jgi:hypothetical protein